MTDSFKLLVVDDDPDLRASLKAALEQDLADLAGCSVATAASATEALARMGREEFAMVITDYKLPGLSGIDLLRAMRERGIRLPRLLVTAYPDPAVLAFAVNEFHVEGVFSKPVDLEDLESSVKQILFRFSSLGRIPPSPRLAAPT